MRIEVNSRDDQMSLANRIAQAPFTKPFVVTADFNDARSLDQNALMWATLREIALKVEWYRQKLKPEEWKDVFTAAIRQQRAVPGLDGGVVMLGLHTSRMSKQEMSELIDLINSFAAENGIEPAKV
jgi:hypothetical protein